MELDKGIIGNHRVGGEIVIVQGSSEVMLLRIPID